MSLSNPHKVGTIFMGPDSGRETTLEKLYSETERQGWNKQTENDYLDRVRAKATQSVKALLAEARKRAELIEAEAVDIRNQAAKIREDAEQIHLQAEQTLDQAGQVRNEAAALRDAAREDGLADGRVQAREELEQQRREFGRSVAVVLLGIHEQCQHIFAAWRQDLAALLKEAVHKSSGLLIDQNRAELLENLLERSSKALLDRKQYTLVVHPDDQEIARSILQQAHKAMPRTANWEIAVDPDLGPGSLVVESDSALVNNSAATRAGLVDEILQNLGIPAGQADLEASAQVMSVLDEQLRLHGVDLESKSESAEHDLEPAAQNLVPDNLSSPDNPELEDLEPAIEPVQAEALPALEADHEIALAQQAPLTERIEEQAVVEPETIEPDQLATDEAQDMVEEFLGKDNQELLAASEPAPTTALVSESGLDPDLADQLLADMGFAPEQNSAQPEADH